MSDSRPSLRPLTQKDLPLVLAWRNSERVRAWMYTNHKISLKEHRAWFKSMKRDKRRAFWIFSLGKRPVGVVSITDIERKHRRCSWGFYLGEKDLPAGTGTIMGDLALERLFEKVGVNKVMGEALFSNQASIAYHRKLGFIEDGRFRAHVTRNGVAEDIIHFSLIRSDWERRTKRRVESSGQKNGSLEIRVGKKLIGVGSKPFIIAEMSGNHNQSLERALSIVDAAAAAGADALKIQTYTADTMTLDLRQGEFLIEDAKSLWKGETLYSLYQKAYTPWDWHKQIFDRCKEKGLIGFSTPFDASSVDFLEELGAPMYKIASFENTDIPLIRRVASTGKPLVISTGMATVAELDETVRTARDAGCRDIILLKCTSAYPAPPAEANLRTIANLRERYGCLVGLSDHTLGLSVSLASISLGATVLERHFTLSRAEGGVDSAFSLEPTELADLVRESEKVWLSLGEVAYGPGESEKASLRFRRSLYIVADMKAGEILTTKNLRSIRPGGGLPPKHYDNLLGKKVNQDIKRGTPVAFNLIASK